MNLLYEDGVELADRTKLVCSGIGQDSFEYLLDGGSIGLKFLPRLAIRQDCIHSVVKQLYPLETLGYLNFCNINAELGAEGAAFCDSLFERLQEFRLGSHRRFAWMYAAAGCGA